MKQKTVTCVRVSQVRKKWEKKPKSSENFDWDCECEFWFSVVDNPSVLGKREPPFSVVVKITRELLVNWSLTDYSNDNLTKVLFSCAIDHIRQKIEEGGTPAAEKITLTMQNQLESRCPVDITKIPTVKGYSFNVEIKNKIGFGK